MFNRIFSVLNDHEYYVGQAIVVAGTRIVKVTNISISGNGKFYLVSVDSGGQLSVPTQLFIGESV